MGKFLKILSIFFILSVHSSNAKEEIMRQLEIFWDYKAANSFSAFELLKEITNSPIEGEY